MCTIEKSEEARPYWCVNHATWAMALAWNATKNVSQLLNVVEKRDNDHDVYLDKTSILYPYEKIKLHMCGADPPPPVENRLKNK